MAAGQLLLANEMGRLRPLRLLRSMDDLVILVDGLEIARLPPAVVFVLCSRFEVALETLISYCLFPITIDGVT